MKGPCKDCEDRKLGCHSRCEAYKAWKAEHDDERKWMNAQQEYISRERRRLAARNAMNRARGWKR